VQQKVHHFVDFIVRQKVTRSKVAAGRHGGRDGTGVPR
jgi:hypothetical protein